MGKIIEYGYLESNIGPNTPFFKIPKSKLTFPLVVKFKARNIGSADGGWNGVETTLTFNTLGTQNDGSVLAMEILESTERTNTFYVATLSTTRRAPNVFRYDFTLNGISIYKGKFGNENIATVMDNSTSQDVQIKPFTFGTHKVKQLQIDGKNLTLQKKLGQGVPQPKESYSVNSGNTPRIGIFAYNNNWSQALNTKDGSGTSFNVLAKTVATGSNGRVSHNYTYQLNLLDWNTIGMVSTYIALGAFQGDISNKNNWYRTTQLNLSFKKENDKYYFQIQIVGTTSGATTTFESGLADNVWKEVPTSATNFLNNYNGYENTHLGLSQANGAITFYTQSSKIDGGTWRGLCMYDVYNYLYE